jgi:hypothetical protein
MATVRFTDADRDSRGFIRLSPPTEDAAPELETPAALPPMRRATPAPAPRVPMPRGLIVLISGGLIGLLLIVLTIRFGAVPQRIVPSTPLPTTAPATAAAAGISTPVPTDDAVLPTATPVAGYWSPDGVRAGEIDLTKITRVVDVRGPWARIELDGGGLVWMERTAVPAALLAAYTPPTALPIPTRVPPTPEPQVPCLTAGTGTQVVTVCGWGDLEQQARDKWIETYGGNVGIVVTPSPQEWNRP